MHGEQQSWHDWDPSKYETKTQPKVQTVGRLQNWSVKDKQNTKGLWFMDDGGKESLHSQNKKEQSQEKRWTGEWAQWIFCFLAFSLVSRSGNFPWPAMDGIKQACSQPKPQTEEQAAAATGTGRLSPGQGSALLPAQPRAGISAPSLSSWWETEARKQTGTPKHCPGAQLSAQNPKQRQNQQSWCDTVS